VTSEAPIPWSNVVALLGLFACVVGVAWAVAWYLVCDSRESSETQRLILSDNEPEWKSETRTTRDS